MSTPPALPAFGFGRHAPRLRGASSSCSPLLHATWSLAVRLLRGPPGTSCAPNLPHGPTGRFQLQTPVGCFPWSLRCCRKTARSFLSVLSQLFGDLPGPGISHRLSLQTCSDLDIAPWFGTPRYIAPAKKRHCFRMVVSMLSCSVSLGAFVYGRLVWSAKLWKPMTRRRKSTCAYENSSW